MLGAVRYVRTRPDVDPDRVGGDGLLDGLCGQPGGGSRGPGDPRGDRGERLCRHGRAVGSFWLRRPPGHAHPLVLGTRAALGDLLWTGERIAAFRPEELVGRISPARC